MTKQEFLKKLKMKDRTIHEIRQEFGIDIIKYTPKTLIIAQEYRIKLKNLKWDRVKERRRNFTQQRGRQEFNEIDGSEYVKHLEDQLKRNGVTKQDGVNSGATNCYVFHGHGL